MHSCSFHNNCVLCQERILLINNWQLQAFYGFPTCGLANMCYTFLCFHTALELNERNIVNVLHEAMFVDGDWEALGLQLIHPSAIRNIRASHHGSAALCMMDTISQWLQSDLEPSWEKLAEAVVKVEGYGEATAAIVRHKAGIGKGYFKSGCD